MTGTPYRFSRARAERTIAVTRVGVGAVSLLAIFLDPAEPARFADVTYALHIGYVFYSILLAAVMWRPPAIRWLPAATHVADIVGFSVFQYLTLGPSSPFFTYFIFAIFCGAVRWGWKGTLATAPVVIVAFVVIGAVMSRQLGPTEFELNRFIIRFWYLVTVAALLLYLGRHEARLREEIQRLAGWPSTVGDNREIALRQVLAHASGIVAARRVVVVWELDQEPRTDVAALTPSGFALTRCAPTECDPWVPDAIGSASFLATNLDTPSPVAVVKRPGGVTTFHGVPLHERMFALLQTPTVASAAFQTERLSGRAFFGEIEAPTLELVPLIEVVTREIGSSLDRQAIHEGARDMAIREDRFAVARDLHDGVLQSLTGARFELQALAGQLQPNTLDETRDQLIAIERALAREQRELRFFIDGLQPAHAPAAGATLAARVEELRERLAVQWKTPITVRFAGAPIQVPPDVEQAIVPMVQEAVVNALKHASPTRVSIAFHTDGDALRIVIADDGHGFPFKGHFDQAALERDNAGPATLRQRAAALGGTLAIDSAGSGSKVVISLPSLTHA